LGNLRVTIKQWVISWEVVQFSWIDPVTTEISFKRDRNRRYLQQAKIQPLLNVDNLTNLKVKLKV